MRRSPKFEHLKFEVQELTLNEILRAFEAP